MIITPAILAAQQIATNNIADGSVNEVKIATGAITSAKIQNLAISTGLLASTAVTAPKIAFGTGTDEVSTDEVPEGSTNQFFTDARAVAAVEAETTLELQNDLTINTDIKIGHHTIQDASYLKTNGMHILTDDAVTDRWSSVLLEEYGSKAFSINNPAIHGQVSGGTVASPAVVGDGVRCLNLAGHARFGTSSGSFDTIGQIKITTNETQSSTNRGGAVSVDLNTTGGTDLKEILKMDGSTTSSANIRFDTSGYWDNTRISTGSAAIVFDDPVTMADTLTATSTVILSNLPTTDPTNAGQLWNDSGTLKISAG